MLKLESIEQVKDVDACILVNLLINTFCDNELKKMIETNRFRYENLSY